MSLQIFRTKHITSDNDIDYGLKRCLSTWDLAFLGIGAIIGTGIFVLTGIAAATQSGPAVVVSFIIAGFACTFAALSYAELASAVGGCGSAYGYSYAAFGEMLAWIIGWDLLLEYGISVAAVANGWSGYFSNALSAIGMPLPEALTKAPKLGGLINLPASAIILVLMVLLIIGVKQSAKANNAMVCVKLVTISVFIAIAAFNVNPANWHPFMPFGWFQSLPDGKTSGILAGASIVFFAYVGFDAVSTAAEEAENPQRDLPVGIVASLVFCTVIYIIVSGLLTGVVPYTDLNVSSPVAHALKLIGFTGASALISTGVIAGLTTVMLVLYYALTRIIFAMSRDGLLSSFFSEVNHKTKTPVRVIVLCGVIMALVAGFMPLGDLAELVNIGTLAAFVLVCLGVIVLRITKPEMARPFRTPFSPLFPMLGMLSCGALMAFLPTLTWLRFIIWLTIGLIIYFVYSIHHSKLSRVNELA
ncbi:Methylthioribose transporter [Candidatus Methylobacter favarea]|uniref:Methylthioribose transporter n=1 Tax=Candidatus Methylobacter favarea TaxID=2707345 RepID=A0A8S0X311_9GAMM|nr:amino acid permease [Candidatus Methylobacter favarea]CAA9892354.1 Methylthioribose transporter [Candidatus Methylobacter favarea]